MHLISTLISIFLFTSAVLSGPLLEKNVTSIPKLFTEQFDDIPAGDMAGVYWDKTNGTFNFATATFDVSTPSGQNGYNVWVTLDAIACSASFTAGISSVVINGMVGYAGWCSWSDGTTDLSGVVIESGHAVRASLNAISPTSGAVVFKNLKTNQIDVCRLSSTHSLCGRSVAWGTLVHQADPISFNKLTIRDAEAYGPLQGSTHDLDGTEIMEISRNGRPATSVEIDGTSVIISRA